MSSPNQVQMNMVPIIDSTTLPDTPAHEWAEGTTSALLSDPGNSTSTPEKSLSGNVGTARDPVVPPFASMASTQSTPGHEFPGAYPRDTNPDSHTSGNVEAAVSNAKDAAYGIYVSAKQYLPAQENVQQALQNASTTAKQYLPESLGAYLPGGTEPTSLPSTEVYGSMGKSSGGVGALPGTLSETSVAKLPAEREQEGLDRAKEFSAEYAHENAWSQQCNASSRDSSGSAFGRGPIGGVGDLPGGKDDADVVRVPEERAVDGELRDLPTNSPPVVTTTNKHATTSPIHHLHPPPTSTNSTATSATNWSTTAQADSDASRVTLPPTPAPANRTGQYADNGVLAPAIPPIGDEDMKRGTEGARGVVNSGFGGEAKDVVSHGGYDGATFDAVNTAGIGAGIGVGVNTKTERNEDKMRGAFEKELPPVGTAKELPSQRSGVVGVGEKGEPHRKRILKECEEMNDLVLKDVAEDDAAKEAASAGHGHRHGHHQNVTTNALDKEGGIGVAGSGVGGHSKNRTGSISSTSSGKSKPTFMDKVKGEAKVIKGKLVKDEEKVEEGKRMMGKV